MNKRELRLSIIVPVLNNADILTGFLDLISKQKYPKEKVEIIIVDGGSRDESIQISKKFGAKVFNNKKVLAEPGVSLGMSKATGDILIVLATDNYLYDSRSLSKYAETFNNKNIYAAFPRHESKSWDSIYTKYINRFTDPFSHFVYGYAANGRTFKKIYKTLEANETYDVYDFKSSKDLPLVAFAQGFAIRSDYKRSRTDSMDDIRPVMEIIKKGKMLAFIHSIPLYHHTVKNLGHFIRKQRWGTRNFLEKKNYGISYRSSQLSDHQRLRMKICPLYALTFLAPVVYSLFYLIKDREVMWLLHAPLCFISAIASIWEVLLYNINRKEIVSRQA